MPAVKQNKVQREKPNWMAASQIAFLQRKVSHKPAEATVEDVGSGEIYSPQIRAEEETKGQL